MSTTTETGLLAAQVPSRFSFMRSRDFPLVPLLILGIIAFVAVFAHGLLAGTDFAQPLLSAIAWLTAALLAIVAFRRLTVSRGRQSPARSKTVAIP